MGVIGNLGVTSGYQKAANYARTATIVWQVVAVASMLAVIGFAVRVFLPVLQLDQQYAGFNWTHFASRLVLLIPIGVLAAYAAAQADRHNEMERRNRKLALEPEAIGPYLAPLPADQQQAFMLQLADRTFGREEPISARRSGKKSPATSIDLTAQLKDLVREAVAEAVKAAKS